MEDQRKGPRIRFKGFTDNWEQRKLGDIMPITSVKRIHQSDWTDKGIIFLRARDIVSSSKNEEITEPLFISEEKYNEYSAISGKVQIGDLLVTGVGTIGVPMLITSNNPIYFKDGNVIWFKNEKKIDGKFFYQSFIGSYIQSYISKSAGTGTVGTYTIDSGKKTPIMLPTKKEQIKIGTYFEQLDNLITLHQRKCQKLIEVKKALLEKMFPKDSSKIPEIRFKGFTNDWVQCKLENFGNAAGGTSIESEFSDDGKYKVISIGSYSETSSYNDQGIRAIYSEKTKNRILNKNDLTMILNDKTSSGRIIGRVLYIDKSGEYVYNQRTERIEVNNTLYNAKFIYHLLNAPEIRKKIIKQSQGNTQIFVNWNTIKNTEYDIPNKKEQIKLVNLFDNIDTLIVLHQHKLEKLKNLKKSMLEKMFI